MSGLSATALFWIKALDGQRVKTGQQRWTLRLLGVHADGDEVWIQAARSHEPRSSLLIHIRPHATVEDVLAAVQASGTEQFRIDVPHAA
jgi:hypothetical protein